jgi:serine/threonine-protein kinase
VRTKRTSDHPTLADSPPARLPAPESPEDNLTAVTRVRAEEVASDPPVASTRTGDPPAIDAIEAMRSDEIDRARMFYRVIMVVALGCVAVLPWIEGNAGAKWAFAAGLGVYCIAETWFVLAIRDPDAYNERNLAVIGAAGVIGGYTGVYFWGVFSPAAAVIIMALYFNSLVGSIRYTAGTYITCAAAQAIMAGLMIGDVIADRGVIRGDSLSLMTQLMTQGLIQGAMLATFLIARLSRRNTQNNVQHLERAIRNVAQRDALLAEARQELERAGWVGGPGRFSEQIIGSFKLGVVVGRGAMGEVYDAVHLANGKPAAVKLLHRNVLADTDQLARFRREIEVVASLQSRNVVDVFEVSPKSANMPYLVMEKLVGTDLGAILRRQRKLPLDKVVTLIEQVSLGLEAARDAGIVHRDLKPHNLFCAQVREHEVWKILDFGVSKLADSTNTLTHGHVVGTPSYMSPEQARGKPVDHRSDVYGLAAIAYRCSTGYPAFSGRDVPAVLHDVAFTMPKRPTKMAPELPDDIDCALALGMAKRAGDRFDTAEDFARAFKAAASGTLDAALHGRARSTLDNLGWGESR